MGMGVQGQALAALPMRTPDPYCRKGWVSQSGWIYTRENLSTPLGFVPRTVKCVASPYTKYTILATTSISIVCTYER